MIYMNKKAITKMHAVIMALIIVVAVIAGAFTYYSGLISPPPQKYELSKYTKFAIDVYDTTKPITAPLAEAKEWASPPSEYAGRTEVLIGYSLPMTGVFAPAGGTQWKAIYEHWAELVNANGGLLSLPVRLIGYDDASDPTRAITNYEKLISVDKVDLLLSTFPTPSDIPVFNAIDDYGKLMINTGAATVEGITNPGFDNIVTVELAAEALTYSCFGWLNDMPLTERPTKVAISYGEFSPFTTSAGVGAREMALYYGYEVVQYEGYPLEVTDMTATVQKAKSAGAEVFLGIHTTIEASQLMVRAMKELNYQPAVYWDFYTMYPAWVDPQRPGYIHPDAYYIGSSAMHWPTWSDPPYKGVASWVDWYETAFGLDVPNWDYGNPIGGCQVLETAVNAAGTLDSQKLMDYIETHSFNTIQGHVEFPAPYHYIRGVTQAYAQNLADGTMQIVWPESLATGEAVYPRPPWNEIVRP